MGAVKGNGMKTNPLKELVTSKAWRQVLLIILAVLVLNTVITYYSFL